MSLRKWHWKLPNREKSIVLQTLVTGFGPFGNVVSNPTERLLEHFAEEEVPGHTLTLCALPTSFSRAMEHVKAHLEIGGQGGKPFDMVLMLGVATGSKNWRVERVGTNWDEASLPDIDGELGSARPIIPKAPETLAVSFPVETLVKALNQARFPAIASESAGAYLCNHVLYRTLHLLQTQNASVRAGFLHPAVCVTN